MLGRCVIDVNIVARLLRVVSRISKGRKSPSQTAKMSRLRYLWVDLGAGLLAPDLLQMK